MRPRLAVVIASDRDARFGEVVARWFTDRVREEGSFDLDVVDLRDADLDPVISMHHPKSGRYSPGVQAFAERIARADAFVFVTPEYNHSYPAPLKHALDSVYSEWNLKPAGIVSYGGLSGGVRAAEHLRPVLAELRIHDIREVVMLPLAPRLIDEDGTAKDESINLAAKNLLTELNWWAQALIAARAATPFPL